MKILLGMSGGVDSTFAALKLLREGNTVEGAVLKMHDYTTVDEAKESAAALGIPLHVLDCREDFEREVVQDLISKYRAARTPNPCVVCNRTVKFERLLRYALSHGFDAIATGHYAAVVRTGEGRYALRRAKDTKKDQTYMLWRLSQEQLSHLILPLSDLHKEEVRAASSDAALEAADRSDSQEICFLPDGDHAAFIESCTGRSPHGSFLDEEGKILGEHRGIIRYTVGQRKGLGVSAASRLFVTKIDPERNTVTLSPNDPVSSSVSLSHLNFSGLPEPDGEIGLDAFVKLRYAAPPAPCRVTTDGKTASIRLSSPVRAVTPGQSAVFYDEDGVLLFGGVIDSAD